MELSDRTGPGREVPMFPLGTVLFPHAPLPLHVFEPRYRVMVRDLLATDGEFGVVLIERGHEVGGGDVRFPFGTLARLVQAAELPDGRYALGCVGVARFVVSDWLPEDPYPRAVVRVLDEPATGEHVEAARAGAFEQLRRVLELVVALGGPDQRAELDAIATDPTRAAFECCRLAPVGALDAQRLLSCADATERFEMLAVLLDDLAAVLSAGLDDR